MVDAYSVLGATDWTSLTHAYGSAAQTPEVLLALLSENADLCGEALAHLDSAVLHQGSLYPATAPSATFVAAILEDPRTMTVCGSALPWDNRERPVRAALLEWLGHVAESAAHRDDGTPDPSEPEAVRACRAIRGELFDAVTPFVDDANPDVRAAARAAVGHLLLAPELAARRDSVANRLLAAAANARPAERATIALILGGWDVPPGALLADPDPSVRAAAALAPCLDADPGALAETRLALADPARADGWFPDGLPQLTGRFRFALVTALLRRTRSFDEIVAEAVAIAGMTNEFTVDFDWGPLLDRAFAAPHGEGEPFTVAQRDFLTALADNDLCWGAIGNSKRYLDRAGLPYHRADLRALLVAELP